MLKGAQGAFNLHVDTPLIRERLIDYIRVHMSDIGGITPMRKLATYCEFYGVRTALHGPGKSRALYAVVHMGSFMHNKRPLKQLVTTATICVCA